MARYSSEEEALEIANAAIYGLGASIWTKDLKKAYYYAARLEDGIVWVNCLNLSHPAIPNGVYKLSGHGLENGIEAAIRSYS